MIVFMTKHHPHDHMPAAQHDALLPAYDLLFRALGLTKIHRTLVTQAELADGQRVLEVGSGTGNLTIRAKRSHPGSDVIASISDFVNRKSCGVLRAVPAMGAARSTMSGKPHYPLISLLGAHGSADDEFEAPNAEVFAKQPFQRRHVVADTNARKLRHRD